MDAAEQFVDEIVPGQVYPQEFVIFRITGYRPDRAEQPVALVGEALVGDLVTFIQRLSEDLGLSADHDGRTACPVDDIARRLNVSAKTLQRYRQRGLVCHYVVFSDGVKRLACFEDAVQRFTSRHSAEIDRAAGFSRVDHEIAETMIREARRQRDALGLSLNAAAKQLAEKYGRSHETVRSLLLRHDRAAGEPIFGEPGPLRDRDVRLIHRAARRGVTAARLARRFSKTPATIHRALNQRRRELLEGLALRWPALPQLENEEAEPLDRPSVTSGLEPRIPDHDALRLIEAARSAAKSREGLERDVVIGYNALKKRAAEATGRLHPNPASGDLDRIETDLRWAAQLKRRLVELALPDAVGAIEQFIGRDLTRQPSEEILNLLRLAIGVAGETVETFEPAPRRRLGHSCGFAVGRALARGRRPPPPTRADTRHEPGSIAIDLPFESICPWQSWLGLPAAFRGLVDRLDPRRRLLVELRYGLGGERAMTLAELAEREGGTPSAAARQIARAEAELRKLP